MQRLLRATGPAEARFFLFVGGFGLLLAAIYWFVSYELAGTVLLGGFGLGAALLGVRLRIERPDRTPGRTGDATEAAASEGPGGPGTPFSDESGRLPGDTLAPLALGLGIALAITAVVFGPWLLVAGIVPAAWGAWTWLAGARDELSATVADERVVLPPTLPGERRGDERRGDERRVVPAPVADERPAPRG
jgi:hypothetical protein